MIPLKSPKEVLRALLFVPVFCLSPVLLALVLIYAFVWISFVILLSLIWGGTRALWDEFTRLMEDVGL